MCKTEYSSLPLLLGLGEKATAAFVGAGGKTTAMFKAARTIADSGKTVIISTTTHIYPPTPAQCRETVIDGEINKINDALNKYKMVTVGTACGDGKLSPPGGNLLQTLADRADFLLLEADGSAGLPVKVPAGHEPVIPQGVTHTALLCGISCIGMPVLKVCHRPALACELLGVQDGHLLTVEDVVEILAFSCGHLRNAGRQTVLLNGAEDDNLRRLGGELAERLIALGLCRVAVGSVRDESFILYEK